MILPAFSPQMSRGISVIPNLSLIGMLQPDLKISHATVTVGFTKTMSGDSIKIDGMIIEHKQTTGNKFVITTDTDPDPSVFPEQLTSPSDILGILSDAFGDDIQILETGFRGGIQNAVINTMNVIDPVPKRISDDNPIAGMDFLVSRKQTTSHLKNPLYKRLGIGNLADPFDMAKRVVNDTLHLPVPKELATRFKSVHETKSIGGFNGENYTGHDRIGSSHVQGIQSILSRNHPWEDLAIIQPFEIPVQYNGILSAHLYRLQKTNKLIPLG